MSQMMTVAFLRLLLLGGVFLYVGAGLFVAIFETVAAARTDPALFVIVCFPVRVLLWPIVVKYDWPPPRS